MREIKFRIWDKSNKSWNQYLLLNAAGKIVVIDDDVGGQANTADNQENYVIQQYTGLKDKNGKEIYEGDIVLSTCPKILNDNFTGVIIFDEGSFLTKIDNNDIRGVFDELEIIGNIFENPELLK